MKSVFVLYHVHEFKDGSEDMKIIGAYSSHQALTAAIERLRGQPGFRENPDLVEDGSGFDFLECEIDKDNWTEGFTAH